MDCHLSSKTEQFVLRKRVASIQERNEIVPKRDLIDDLEQSNILVCVQLGVTLAASDLSQEENRPICFIVTIKKISKTKKLTAKLH